MESNKREDRSYGFVVVYTEGGVQRFLLVRHVDGHWGFPKGHPEGSETTLETARRELAEECGITDISLDPDHSFAETYVFSHGAETIEKTNTFFLGFVDSTSVVPQAAEITEWAFATIEESENLNLFPDTKRILKEAYRVVCS